MGFLDSLKTGFSNFFDSGAGSFLGQTVGQFGASFATGAGTAAAQRLFGSPAAGSPFAAIPTSNQFGAFGPQFGQQFGARSPFQTFPQTQPGTGFPVLPQQPQFPIPFNPLLPSNALPNAQFTNALPFQTVGFSPTGAPVAFPTSRNFGFQQAAFDLPFIDIVPQGQGALVGTPGGGGGSLTSPFRPTMAGAAAQPFIATNPVTGRPTWFRPAGRPILFSGDLTTCKRVEKVARRARRATRKR